MAKALLLSFSGVCCLVALLLGQPSLGHRQQWPFSDPNEFFGLWNKMKDDAIIYQATIMYYHAMEHLNKKYNCTYLSAPEEKVHVQMMKYLCFLELATFPAFNIHKVRVKSCGEYKPSPPPFITLESEPEKEEGTPYM